MFCEMIDQIIDFLMNEEEAKEMGFLHCEVEE
jgi:hypothetical protein